MEYTADSMWNTLIEYPSNVWNIQKWCIIPSPLLCGIRPSENHIEPNHIWIQIEMCADTVHTQCIDDLKLYAKTGNEVKAMVYTVDIFC